jgi:peptidoglycan hydrolase-like protein with peptidoglycan-binding domain
MQPKKFRILSAITAGSLALAVVAITASSGTSRPAKPPALAAQIESFSPVDLDKCPTLWTGYPTGGCVAQLQTDLKIIQDPNLVVDGAFGPVHSQTWNAVTAFQTAHDLPQDGMVGPNTKNAIAAALSGSSVLTPTAPPATAPAPPATAPAPPATAPAPGTSGGSPVTNHCGFATCSAYLSRSVTRAAYQKSTVGGGGFAAVAAVICGVLSIPPLTPVGIACFAEAALHGPWIVQELSDAATQHGASGACLKVTYTRPPVPPAITWWSTNNGQYCKD